MKNNLVTVLSAEDCERLIEACEDHLVPARIRHRSGFIENPSLRKALSFYPHLLYDETMESILYKVQSEICRQSGLPIANQEFIEYCKYEPEGHFAWHRDEGG